MTSLIDPKYMSFPFRLGAHGAETSRRREHVRQQIEQVLFTDPGERIFRSDFGAGVRRLVFEANGTVLWDLTKQRLLASLSEVLQGEVDPSSIHIEVGNQGDEDTLYIRIAYRLATINREEEQVFALQGGGLG